MSNYINKQVAIILPPIPKGHRDYQTYNLDDAYESGWYDLQKCIKALPPADVQLVVHGEWIKTAEGNAIRDKCSKCESLYPNAFGYNWCPNCGAYMGGE